MSSSAKSAPRDSADRTRLELTRLAQGLSGTTITVFDQITACQDYAQASTALSRALHADDHRAPATADVVLPGQGWLLPP